MGVASLLLASALAGCGDGSAAGSSCQPARREALDPASAQHLLPGSDDPVYQTDPPTSGPHQVVAGFSGARTEPMTRPVQVSQLERGKVLLQYRDLGADKVSTLSALAGPEVIVAPNADLPDRVVATAWTFKQVCAAVDVDQLRAFALDRQGKGPGTP